MKLTIIILMIIVAHASFGQHLNNDSTIRKVFNDSEIKDLNSILNFFDKQICDDNNVTDIVTCYREFLEKISIIPDSSDFYVPISFKDQRNLYHQISDSTFNQIWLINMGWKGRPSADTLKYVDLNFQGAFQVFLDQLGKEYSLFEGYLDAFKGMGGMCPSMFWHPLMYHEQYNISDIKIRLFVAIHFLTINDQIERDEKY